MVTAMNVSVVHRVEGVPKNFSTGIKPRRWLSKTIVSREDEESEVRKRGRRITERERMPADC